MSETMSESQHEDPEFHDPLDESADMHGDWEPPLNRLPLAEQAGLSAAETDELLVAGFLHDVGKQDVPKNVLDEVKPLSDKQHVWLKKHSTKGAFRIENDIGVTPRIILLVQLHHQLQATPALESEHGQQMIEDLFPDRADNTKFRTMLEILETADKFDALLYPRAYKSRKSLDDVHEIFESSFAKNGIDPNLGLQLAELYTNKLGLKQYKDDSHEFPLAN